MKAQSILTQAAAHLAKRAEQYDNPEGERSIPAVVEAFNAIKGSRVLSHSDGWLLQVLLKLVRAQTAKGKPLIDSVEDATAYAALMGEEMLVADEPFKVGEMPKPGPITKFPGWVEPWPEDPFAAEREKAREEANKKARQAVDALVGRPPMITEAMVQAHEAFARSEAERLRKQFEGRLKEAVLPPADAAYGAVNHGVTLKGREPGSVHRDDTGERIVTNTGQVVTERDSPERVWCQAGACQNFCTNRDTCPCYPRALI